MAEIRYSQGYIIADLLSLGDFEGSPINVYDILKDYALENSESGIWTEKVFRKPLKLLITVRDYKFMVELNTVNDDNTYLYGIISIEGNILKVALDPTKVYTKELSISVESEGE